MFYPGRHSIHHDAVTVEPLYDNGTLCSQKAVLIAESTQPIRLSSVILAREIGMLRQNTLCNCSPGVEKSDVFCRWLTQTVLASNAP